MGGDGENGEANSLVGRLTALAGLATVAIAIVYTAGAAVYWAALSNRDVPANLAIATSLPREFLIGTGLLFVALPIGITALLLFALTPIIARAGDRGGQWIVATFLTAAGIALIWAVQPNGVVAFIFAVIGAGLTIFALTALLVILVEERRPNTVADDRDRETKAKDLKILASARTLGSDELETLKKLEEERVTKDKERRSSRQLRDYLVGVSIAAIVVWGFLAGTARTNLPAAKLCTTDGGQYPGFLIGETGSRIYVGETEKGAENRGGGATRRPSQIISAPTARVAKLFIGSNRAPCTSGSVTGDETANNASG